MWGLWLILSIIGVLLIYCLIAQIYHAHKTMYFTALHNKLFGKLKRKTVRVSEKSEDKNPNIERPNLNTYNSIVRSRKIFFQSTVNLPDELIPQFKSSSKNFFEIWKTYINNSDEQHRRIKKSLYSKINCYVDEDKISASIQSERDNSLFYQVCYDKCTCPDFIERQKPCKHIYRLAFAMGEFALSIDGSKIMKRNDGSKYVFFMSNESKYERVHTKPVIVEQRNSDYSEHSREYFEFDDKYYEKILKLVEKAELLQPESCEYTNPNLVLKQYEKCLNKFDEIEKICFELGGIEGQKFYYDEFGSRLAEVKENLSFFEENVYEKMLDDYKQNHEKQITYKGKYSQSYIPNQKVYISSSGKGTRYHCDVYCANKSGNVICLTVEEARNLHFYPCSKCFLDRNS